MAARVPHQNIASRLFPSRSRVSGPGAVARAAALIADGCVGVARAALLIVWELAQRVAPSILDRFAARLDALVGRNVY